MLTPVRKYVLAHITFDALQISEEALIGCRIWSFRRRKTKQQDFDPSVTAVNMLGATMTARSRHWRDHDAFSTHGLQWSEKGADLNTLASKSGSLWEHASSFNHTSHCQRMALGTSGAELGPTLRLTVSCPTEVGQMWERAHESEMIEEVIDGSCPPANASARCHSNRPFPMPRRVHCGKVFDLSLLFLQRASPGCLKHVEVHFDKAKRSISKRERGWFGTAPWHLGRPPVL